MALRKNITWKKPAELPPEALQSPKIRPYVSATTTPAVEEKMAPYLRIGSLWSFVVGMGISGYGPDILLPQFPYVEKASWKPPVFKAGTYAMYTGVIRTEESAYAHSSYTRSMGRIPGADVFRVNRYTFIIGEGRYIVPDLSWLIPL